MVLPQSIAINAWTGARAPTSSLSTKALTWGLNSNANGVSAKDALLAPKPLADARNWRHPDIGWGLVLPNNPGLTDADSACAIDAPSAIQKLVASRENAPVLRYMKARDGYLRRYSANGKTRDLSVFDTKSGTAEDCLPKYLLIYGGPEQIPWSFQYALNMSRFVGRLSLTDKALDNYVDALLTDWSAAPCDARNTLTWSVNHGSHDITGLMDAAISKRLFELFRNDADLAGATYLTDAQASEQELLSALSKDKRPALVISTSHGMTGPADNPALLKEQLGALVDCSHNAISPTTLAGYAPFGAIWYAHACCSAGSENASRYVDLFDSTSTVHEVLQGVSAGAGSCVAPLPQALLGSSKPLRAFVGHVEPTFDWTLRDPKTNQALTHSICDALYSRLYQADCRTPIGFALQNVFNDAGSSLALWLNAREASNRNDPGARERALYYQLVAMDRQGLVILGDPTASLPQLP